MTPVLLERPFWKARGMHMARGMARRLDATGSAEHFMPARKTLAALREAAVGCRGCDLYKRATQTVFGERSRDARVMLVGEQPGHEEAWPASRSSGPRASCST